MNVMMRLDKRIGGWLIRLSLLGLLLMSACSPNNETSDYSRFTAGEAKSIGNQFMKAVLDKRYQYAFEMMDASYQKAHTVDEMKQEIESSIGLNKITFDRDSIELMFESQMGFSTIGMASQLKDDQFMKDAYDSVTVVVTYEGMMRDYKGAEDNDGFETYEFAFLDLIVEEGALVISEFELGIYD